jgi:hypothetical protein
MNVDGRPTTRRAYLRATGAATLATAGLAGCLGEASGTLATRVTDQPGDIADFESCVVTIVGFWLGPGGDEAADDGDESADDEDDEDDDSSGREYHELDEPREADLVQLRDGETQLIDERELPTGEHGFLQLDTDGVDATLGGGESATVEVPGEAPLKFAQPFGIREDSRTVFTADFTPVERGQSGTYLLQPVADGVEVAYEDAGDA